MALEQSKLYDIMIACLKKDNRGPEVSALAALSTQDWSNIMALAAMQRISPLFWHRLRQKGLENVIPETAAAILRESSRRNVLRNLRLNGELCRLLTRLEKESIPLIILKGMVMSNVVYENIGLREMNDIDVLTKPEYMQRVADILMDMGYESEQPVDINITLQTGHHLPALIKKKHAKIEIHWNLTNPDKYYTIDPNGLWERAVPVQIAGCKTWMLSPEDMLLHLCLHTSYLHQFIFGLRPFCDISEFIDHFKFVLDWQIVADRAFHQKWENGVYLALRMASELMGANVHSDVLKRLQPADMSERILETARNQIFTDKYFAASIPITFAQLLEKRDLREKIKIFSAACFFTEGHYLGKLFNSD